MKKTLLFLLAAALCASAVPARAADTGLTIKAGVTTPVDGSLQGSGGTMALGAEYTLAKQAAAVPFNVALYGDLLNKSFGAGFSVRTDTVVYLGAGAGLYHASVTQPPSCTVLIPGGCPSTTSTASGAGTKVFGGFNAGKSVSIEAAYHFLPRASGVNTNAFSAELALHF